MVPAHCRWCVASPGARQVPALALCRSIRAIEPALSLGRGELGEVRQSSAPVISCCTSAGRQGLPCVLVERRYPRGVIDVGAPTDAVAGCSDAGVPWRVPSDAACQSVVVSTVLRDASTSTCAVSRSITF
jgi:hypothetical protein